MHFNTKNKTQLYLGYIHCGFFGAYFEIRIKRIRTKFEQCNISENISLHLKYIDGINEAELNHRLNINLYI